MDAFTLTTPVALLVFNRPKETSRVFAAIREARPRQLLIIADGPRPNRPGESNLCSRVRQIVDQVDWPCTVYRNYSDVNLGCKRRVASGLDWVFAQVDEAIILEDDCLPDNSFFRFCQELLEYYRHDHRIGMISGDNFQFGRQHNNDSYYFSGYFHVWGWATWRDRWVGSFDVAMKQWPAVKDEPWLAMMLNNDSEMSAWKNSFEKAYCGRIDTWDYQWVFANWLKGRLCILPVVNLITNIGFNLRATHTKTDTKLAKIDRFKMFFPLEHPVEVSRNPKADECSQHVCLEGSYVKSLFKWLIGLIK